MIIRTLALVLFLILLIVFNSNGQMTSENYKLTNGLWIGGGGISSGSGTVVTGSVPSSDGQLSFADNWVCYTGFSGTGFDLGGTLLAFYTNQVIDTTEISDHLLKVSYGGGAGELSGRVYFRPGGAVSYNVDVLIKAQGDTLFTQISSEDMGGIRGLEFYFRLARGSDTIFLASSDSPYVWVNHFSNADGQIPNLTRASSYRMIGIPIEVEGSRQTFSVFEDDLGQPDPAKWRLGNHIPLFDSVVVCPECAPVQPGQGYWLITKTPESFGAAGYSVRPEIIHKGLQYFPISVSRGWNQIANPFGFAVDFRDALFEQNGVIGTVDTTADIFWYAGAGYSTPKIMDAWAGYFFFALDNSTRILIPYQEFGIPPLQKIVPKSLQPDNLDWLISVQMETEGQISEISYAGISELASYYYDQNDKPMPPAPPGKPVCGFMMKHDNPFLWQVDVHQTIDSISKWEIKFGQGSNRQLIINQLEQLPESYSVLLVLDVGTQISIPTNRFIPLPDDSHFGTLIIGLKQNIISASDDALPDDFALNQNFPNPFNPNTTIRFSLPKPGPVSLKIYNLLGQEISQLLNQQMTAGVHSVVWHGRLADGSRVASGVYLYRLVSEKFSASKKMVLLK